MPKSAICTLFKSAELNNIEMAEGIINFSKKRSSWIEEIETLFLVRIKEKKQPVREKEMIKSIIY